MIECHLPGWDFDENRLSWSTKGLIQPQKTNDDQNYSRYEAYYSPANKDHVTAFSLVQAIAHNASTLNIAKG